MKQKLQEYALIAEIVGGIAIVTSLLFVGLQINQNHEMMRAQTRNDISMALTPILSNLTNNQDLVDLLFAANEGKHLSDAEMYRIYTHTELIFRYWENAHYQYRQNLYDESEFSRHRDAMKFVIADIPFYVKFVCESRNLYSEPFMIFIDDLLPNGSCLE